MFGRLIVLLVFQALASASISQDTDSSSLKNDSQTTLPEATVSARIVGGSPAPPDRYPYIASLRNQFVKQHSCGGVLIHPDWVATAAHCVDTSRSFASVVTSPFPVYIGGLLRETYKEMLMGDAMLHPEWDGDRFGGHDFALVKLNESSRLPPIALPSPGAVSMPGDLLATMGWGRLQARGSFASILQVANEMELLSETDCQDVFEESITNVLCVGLGESGACAGDQGGPLIRSSENDNFTEDVLVGIATAQTGTRTASCAQSGIPGVYTSVDLVLPFISEMLESE